MFGKIKKLWKKEKKVMAILNIEGPISAAGEGRFRKEGGTQEILDFLYALLDKDERLDGLLIRMNTPGGAAAASEEVALLLDRVKKERKIPVVVTMADVCCSGGYMIACVADTIFATRGTMTGSIGCIMQIPNFEGLSKKLGVTYVTIKAGKMKDIGNPSREMTTEEKEYLNGFARETHDIFRNLVLTHRPDIKNQDEMFDGRPVGAVQARENGLIDEFGGYYDAYDHLLHLMGEDNDKKVEFWQIEHKKGFIRRLLEGQSLLSGKDLLSLLTDSTIRIK